MKNQRTRESEILRCWSLPPATSNISRVALENEYFYFTKYVVVCAWIAFLPASEDMSIAPDIMNSLLLSGESYYVFPPTVPNEWIGIFGIHQFLESRKLEWLEALQRSTSHILRAYYRKQIGLSFGSTTREG